MFIKDLKVKTSKALAVACYTGHHQTISCLSKELNYEEIMLMILTEPSAVDGKYKRIHV